MNEILSRNLSDVTTGTTTPTEVFIKDTSDQNILKICLILAPVVIGVFQFVFMFLAYKLYIEFGWKIYKKIGADPHMRSKRYPADLKGN